MMRRRFAIVFALVASLATIVGCSSASSSGASASSSGKTGTTTSASKVVLGMSFCYLDNSGMVTYRTAETAAAKALGWKVLQPTNANNSQSQQLTDINNLITEGATALDIHQCTANGIVPAILEANKKNIPVFVPDQAASGGKVAITAEENNVQEAATDCTQLISALKQRYGSASGIIVQLQGDIGSEAGADRTKGFEACMKAEAPNVTILTVPTQWEAAQGATGLQTLLNAHPNIRAIFMQSDIVFSTAISELLKQKGLLVTTSNKKHIILFGIDGGCNMMQLIRGGYADFTVSSPLNGLGPAGMPYLQLAVDGKLNTIKPGTISTLPGSKGDKISEISTGLQVDIPSTLITPANATSPTQWANSQGCTGTTS